MSASRILVLSVSAGAGHLRAADALCQTAATPEFALQACHLDVMQCVSAGFRKIYTDFYVKLVNKAPRLWGWLYQASHEATSDSSLQRLRQAVERLNTRPLLQKIAQFAPDIIICTHFLPAAILAHVLQRGQMQTPVWVQVTDFDLHRLWIQPQMRGYFAANEEVAWRMRHSGISSHSVFVTGIPVLPAFASARPAWAFLEQHGLSQGRPTLMLMGGGAGLGALDAVAERLLNVPLDLQLLVLAGHNAELLTALQQLAGQHRGRMLPLGYTEDVAPLMACADLLISKPGGLTSSECLALGKPMLIHSPIPGQEERNADYLLEQGVAMKASDATALEYRVQLLLREPERLWQMSSRALALGRPQAARQVLRIVLGRQA